MVQRPVLSCHHFNKQQYKCTPNSNINQQYPQTIINIHRHILYIATPDRQRANHRTKLPLGCKCLQKQIHLLIYIKYNTPYNYSQMEHCKPKKQKFRKYQFTKPFKERDKSKDFGKDIPLKKSGRLKFPQKPQYYTLYTVKSLQRSHPFFNIRNKDIADVKRAIEQTKKQLQKQQMKNSTNTESKQPTQINKSSSALRSSALGSQSESKSSTFADLDSNHSSLGVVTISSKKSKENPFSQGFAVTSGPKIYSKASDRNESRDVSAVHTPKMSGNQVGKSAVSGLSLSGLSHLGEQVSL